jgi:glycosyltransferase involved in cell wall biosynthesis
MTAGISVIVSCYKQEAFLFECLNSLIAQTFTDWEALVVDDCSPGDKIPQIVASYGDPRIRYLRHEHNRGLSASRNTAIRTSRAPLLAILDSDDFLHPEFLFSTSKTLEKTEADCAFTDFQLVGLSSELWRNEIKTADDLSIVQWIPGPGTLFRREVWARIGGYCESREIYPNEDWDFWISAMSNGASFTHVARALYFYRRHANSIMASHLVRTEWKSREFIIARHAEFFSINNRKKQFKVGGLLKSAHACKAAGYGVSSYLLIAKAIKINPALLFRETISAGKNIVRDIVNGVRRRFSLGKRSAGHSRADIQFGERVRCDNRTQHWDAVAADLHNRYGYLSHDYAVLGQIIEQTGARSVLEIGCGSGRLMPVYLEQKLDPIIAQDISAEAMKMCKQRFFCQNSIYFVESAVDGIPASLSVDLIVSTRVLQHIVDYAAVRRAIMYLAPRTRSFFLNEATSTDMLAHNGPSTHAHDYEKIFEEVGFKLATFGKLHAERGTRQTWKLFEKDTHFLSSGMPKSTAFPKNEKGASERNDETYERGVRVANKAFRQERCCQAPMEYPLLVGR